MYKAQSLRGKEIPDLDIQATSTVPSKESNEVMFRDAVTLHNALRASLPQGTLEQLRVLFVKDIAENYQYRVTTEVYQHA